MKLNKTVRIIFKNDTGDIKHISISMEQLLEYTSNDFYEWLDNTSPCTSSSCNNESQNFCDCGGNFEDYEIVDVEIFTETSEDDTDAYSDEE